MKVPSLQGIRIHAAHPGSRLGRLAARAVPYWAFAWAGGLALAHHLLARPETVAGLRVLDLGAGSGLVAIAAAMAGARTATAADIDPYAGAAVRLNAEANGVAVAVVTDDLAGGPAPAGIDLVLAGDVFYEAVVAARMSGFLGRCADSGIAVLVGDPGRHDLPRDRLRLVAEYPVADFGDGAKMAPRRAGVFAFSSAAGSPATRLRPPRMSP